MLSCCLLTGCVARMSDLDLAMEAPIGTQSRESMTARECRLFDELTQRSRRYPHKLDADALAIVIQRQVLPAPESLFTVVTTDESNDQIEIELAIPRRYESQRDVVVVVEDSVGAELLAFRPWRWSFSIFQLAEDDRIPLNHARFQARPGGDGSRVDLVLKVFIVEDGWLESPAYRAILARGSRLVLRTDVSLPL